MTADERVERLIMQGTHKSLQVLCAWLWEALKSRLMLSGGGSYYDDLDEWASKAEQVAQHYGR